MYRINLNIKSKRDRGEYRYTETKRLILRVYRCSCKMEREIVNILMIYNVIIIINMYMNMYCGG